MESGTYTVTIEGVTKTISYEYKTYEEFTDEERLYFRVRYNTLGSAPWSSSRKKGGPWKYRIELTNGSLWK